MAYVNRDELAVAIGARIRQARLAAGLSQQALAAAIGAQRPSLTRWETGTMPDAGVVKLACEVLGVSATEILGVGQDDPAGQGRRLNALFGAEGRRIAERITSMAEDEIWSRILTGQVMLPTGTMQSIAAGYGVSLPWLLVGRPITWLPDLDASIASRMKFLRVATGFSLADGDDAASGLMPKDLAEFVEKVRFDRGVFARFEANDSFLQTEIGRLGEVAVEDWLGLMDAYIGTGGLKLEPHELPWPDGHWKEWFFGQAPPR